MITIKNISGAYDLRGLSTDRTSMVIANLGNNWNGTKFYEIDTGNTYYLDKENSEWIQG